MSRIGKELTEDQIKLLESIFRFTFGEDYPVKKVYDKKGTFRGIKHGRITFNPLQNYEQWYEMVLGEDHISLDVSNRDVTVTLWYSDKESGQSCTVKVSEVIEMINDRGDTDRDYLIKVLPFYAMFQLKNKIDALPHFDPADSYGDYYD